MNALDKLVEKKEKHGEQLTALEMLVLACGDPNLQLEAAAELHDLHERAAGKPRPFHDPKDMSEIVSHHV